MNLIKRLGWPGVFKLVLLFLAGVIALRVYYWLDYQRNRAPGMRTPEYHALHSVKPGQVNELQIGEYRFRFPAENFPEPYTSADLASDIVKGKADRATVHLDLSLLEKQMPVMGRVNTSRVEVEYWNSLNWGERLKAGQEEEIRRGPWKAIEDLPEIGLRRYTRATEGWWELTYLPTDPAIKRPDGALMLYNCKARYKATEDRQSVYATDQPSICRVSFRHAHGPYIWYYLPGPLMPHWQEVHREVIKFVDSTLIESKEK